MNRIREQFLLHRIRSKKDAEAYAELYDVYVQRIYRYVFFKVRRRADVEEIVSEVFTGAWKYFCDKTVTSANALLYKIARAKVADYYRKNGGEITLDIQEYDAPSDEDVAGDVERSSEMQRVVEALKSINKDYAEIISMRYMDQMEVAEIARALGKTANNVRVTIHRAMSALRTQITIQTDHAKLTSKSSRGSEE